MVMSIYFNDHSTEPGHGRRSLRSGAVVVGARMLTTCIQILTVLVLARLLSPEDYGLVAMVTAITVFAPLLVSLGTPDPVVQRAHITEKEISALFWISLAIGCSAAALMAASGPLIARFYGEPRLTSIAGVSALTFVVSALSCQHNTLLRRAMKFKDLAAVEVCANLLSACGAIAMAVYGLDYWALVLRPVITTFFIASGSWLRCRWVPGHPAMSVGTKEILRQGLHCMGYYITDYIAGSSDRIMIGYRSGPVLLGYYQNAMFIYDNLSQLLALSAHNVVVASLGKAQNNLDDLRRLWRKALSMLGFYVMPAFGILAVTGQDLIPVLFGSKWSHSGVIISILALRGIPHTAERTAGWLHVVAGRTDRWMRWGLVALCAQLIALFCGLPYGPTGVATAFVVCSFIMFIPAIAYSGAPLDIRVIDVITVLWRPQIAALLAAAIGFTLRFALFTDLSPILRIILLGLAYAAAYVTIAVVLLHERMPIQVMAREVVSFSPIWFGLSRVRHWLKR
jgi:PST family polysaccharide transporter